MKSNQKRMEVITLYAPKELIEAVDQEASKQDRSRAWLLRQYIQQGVAHEQ